MKITAKSHKSIIPIVTAGLGLAVLGTGIGLALADPTLAMLSAGTSNLSMVLSITGTTAFIASIFAFYWLLQVDKVKNKVEGILQPYKLGYNLPMTATGGAITIAMAAITYGAVHCGMAQLIPTSWSVWASLGLQAGVGCVMGCITVVAVHAILFIGVQHDSISDIYDNRRMHIFSAIGGGLLGAAASVAGPALTHAFGAVAANTTEAIVLESLIAVSIASLLGVLAKASYILDDAGYLGEDQTEYRRVN